MKKPEKVTPLRWLYAVLGKIRTAILHLTLIRIVSGLQGTFFAIVLKRVIDAGVEKNSHQFFIQLVALLAVALLGVVLSVLGSYCEEKSKAQLERRFRSSSVPSPIRTGCASDKCACGTGLYVAIYAIYPGARWDRSYAVFCPVPKETDGTSQNCAASQWGC